MKKKILALLLILTIVCSLFVFVACNGPSGEDRKPSDAVGGEQNQPSQGNDHDQSGEGNNNSSNDNNQSGGEGNDSSNDNNQSGEVDKPKDSLIPAYKNYKGEEIDYSLYFTTDGNGKIIGLSDYAIEKREDIIQLEIPEKIGNEEINAIDFDSLSLTYKFPFMRVMVIPKNIEIIEGKIFKDGFLPVIYCEPATQPDGWCDGWIPNADDEYFKSSIVWDCENNEIADDGKMFGVSSDGMLFSLKNGEANLLFSGKSKEENIQLKSMYVYNGEQFALTKIMTYSFASPINGMDFVQNNVNMKSISIPESVVLIEAIAFACCDKLQEISLPENLTHIGMFAFAYSGLTNIYIPSSVTSIGESAFYDCSSLTIYCEAESQPSGWNTYWNPSNCPVVWGFKRSE